MKTDFLDAFERHWTDAELLFDKQRWANADHLYGLAAECGLKRLMQAFGMPVDAANNPKKGEDRKHANEIWDRYEGYRKGHHQGAGYVLAMSNPFSDWKVSQRYAHQSNFDKEHVQRHREGAISVRALVKKAKYEGLI